MPVAEIRRCNPAVDSGLVDLARRLSIGIEERREPKIYKPEDICSGFLSVALAGNEFKLPIREEGGVRFAWLDPSGVDAAFRKMLIIKAGGGLMREREQFLPGISFEFPDIQIGGITTPFGARADFNEEAWAVRYRPVTGKDKLMYLTATQWTQMQIALHSGGVLVSCEDVVTTGTTIEAMRRLLKQVSIREPMSVVTVAREGESYTGQMEFAIQIPVIIS